MMLGDNHDRSALGAPHFGPSSAPDNHGPHRRSAPVPQREKARSWPRLSRKLIDRSIGSAVIGWPDSGLHSVNLRFPSGGKLPKTGERGVG